MGDSLIRCANGCGAVLSFQRLQEGARGPRGVTCERCVAERVMTDCAKMLPAADQPDFIARGVARVMGDPSPDTGAHHG